MSDVLLNSNMEPFNAAVLETRLLTLLHSEFMDVIEIIGTDRCKSFWKSISIVALSIAFSVRSFVL